MFFRVTSNFQVPKEIFFYNCLKAAKYIIYNYPFKESERLLDSYIQQHFKMGLRSMCNAVINSLQVSQPAPTELLLTFKDPELDKIARFITYGDGFYYQGSFILLDAFGARQKGK